MLYNTQWEVLDYTHAYFILPISLWLSWLNRDKIKKTFQELNRDNNNLAGLLILILGIIIFIFGYRQNYLSITTFSLLPVLVGSLIYLYGTAMVKALWFPLLYLILLIPPPLAFIDTITLPLRYGIAEAAEFVLRHLHYPISRDGLLLTIGYNDIYMGQPCSGFRSLITLSSLGVVYVYISKGSSFKKLLLTTFIVPLALLGNLVRVIILCLITFYFGEEAGQGFFHNFSGIVMFIITILGLMGLESVLGKKTVVNRPS